MAKLKLESSTGFLLLESGGYLLLESEEIFSDSIINLISVINNELELDSKIKTDFNLISELENIP